MTKMEIVLIILGIVFLLLFAGYCIPVLIQIRRTAKGMNETIQHLNQGLPLIIKNLEEITTNINRTTTLVHREVTEITLTMQRIHGIMSVLLGLEEVLRHRMILPFSRTFRTSLAVFKGIRACVAVLKDHAQDENDDKP
jgi:uncharacterized protein YoxC